MNHTDSENENIQSSITPHYACAHDAKSYMLSKPEGNRWKISNVLLILSLGV